jgi:hypothetical protein
MLQIVPLERGDARGEAAALAAGPQTQVDGERDAGGRDVAQDRGQALDGETVKPVGVDPLAAVGRAVVAENQEHVEIRARHELATAELA